MSEKEIGFERVQNIDLREVPKSERFDHWRRYLTGAEGARLECTASEFSGTMRKVSLSDLNILEISTNTPHRLIRAKRPELCVVNINRKVGNAWFRGSREYELRPGELILHDTNCEYELDYRSGIEILALSMPRSRLEPYVPSLWSLFDEQLTCDKVLVTSLAELCLHVLAEDHALSPATNDNLAAGIVALLGAALQDAAEKLPQAPTWSQKALLQRAKQFIREQLDQPELTPRSVSDGLGISVGYLHRLFQLENSSVMRFVMAERLDAARLRLRRARTDESIGLTAFACGFSDASHFARAFRNKFGVSPSRYRAEAIAVSQHGAD